MSCTPARAAYEQSLDIGERLALADPGNAMGQRDLWFSFSKIAQLLEKQNSPEAIQWWRKAYEQITAIQKRGILLPGDEKALEYLRDKSQ